MCALYSRAQARDYIDVDAAARDGRYSNADLLRLARDHDPGFDDTHFADALRAIKRLPIAEFMAYGLLAAEVEALVTRTQAWADRLRPPRDV